MRKKTAEIQRNVECPVRDVLDRIGDQWSTLVLEALADRTMRFNALKRDIGDVSQHMLARTLRKLEQDGFVVRTFYPVIPPRVDYALTPLGQSLLQPIRSLTGWARSNHASILAARDSYRDRTSSNL